MELGLYSTMAIMLGFSILVIVLDEIIHARRRKKNDATKGGVR